MVDERGRSVAEIAGDLLFERRQAVGDAAAERRGHPTGAEEIPRRQEQEAFWKSFITPETEQAMLAQGMAAGEDPKQTRLKIAGAKYKRRWELWEQKGELADRIAWAKEMVTLGPPPLTPADEPELPEAPRVDERLAAASPPSPLLASPPGPASQVLMASAKESPYDLP